MGGKDLSGNVSGVWIGERGLKMVWMAFSRDGGGVGIGGLSPLPRDKSPPFDIDLTAASSRGRDDP